MERAQLVNPGMGVEQNEGAPTFEEIYEAHAERVLNLAYRMSGDSETARDLTQEIFIKVYESLGTFERRSQVFTWLYRIAVNHIINHLRKERRRRWVSLMDTQVSDLLHEEGAEAESALRTAEPPADAKLEAADRARLVWGAIRSLPVKYRAPLVLYHYDEMSYKEIADALGLSLSAVETRIHRAKRKLAKTLEPWVDRI